MKLRLALAVFAAALLIAENVKTVGSCLSSNTDDSNQPQPDETPITTTVTYQITPQPSGVNNEETIPKKHSPSKAVFKGDFEILPETAPAANASLRQNAVNFATLAFAFHGREPNHEQVVAGYIKNQLDSLYGPTWLVVVTSGSNRFQVMCDFAAGDFVALQRRTLDSAFIAMFRPTCFAPAELHLPPTSWNQDLILGDIEILDKSHPAMHAGVKQDAVNFAMLGYQFEKTKQGIGKYIKTQFEHKYGGRWVVIVSDGDFSGAFDVNRSNLIFLRKANFYIAIMLPNCEGATAAPPTTTTPAPTPTSSSGLSPRTYRRNIAFTTHPASKAPEPVRQFAIQQAEVSVRILNSTYDRCNFIKAQFEQRYSGRWFCGSGRTWSARYRYQGSNVVVLIAAGPTYTSYMQIYQESCSNTRSIKKVRTTATSVSLGYFELMPDSDSGVLPVVKQDMANYAMSAISKNSDPGSVCTHVRSQLELKYGGYWTVAAGEIMAIAFSYNTPHYIRLRKSGSSYSILAFMHQKC